MFFEKLVDTPVRGVVYEGAFEDLARTELGDVADPARDRHSGCKTPRLPWTDS